MNLPDAGALFVNRAGTPERRSSGAFAHINGAFASR
jgi:hypothetical protein